MICAGSEGYINHGLEMEDRERVPRSQSRQSRQQEVRRYKYFLSVHRYFYCRRCLPSGWVTTPALPPRSR